MKKRIISLLLVLAMAISMISCGNAKNEEKPVEKKPDVTALYQSLADMDVKTSELTLDLDVSGKCLAETKMDKVKASIKGSAIIQDENKAQVELAYHLGDDTEFKQLTTFIIDGKSMYLDFATLKNAAVELSKAFGFEDGEAMASMIPDAKFIKIDEATINTLLKEAGEEEITIPSIDLAEQKENQKVLMAGSEYLFKTLHDALKDVTPELVSGSDREINFNITKENLTGFCDAMLALDLGATIDGLVQKMTDAGNAKQYTDIIKEYKKDITSGVKEAFDEFKKEKDNFNEFAISTSVKVDGEKGARKLTDKLSLNIADEEDKVAIAVETTSGEQVAEGKTITIPTDATDFMTFALQVGQLMGL